MNDQMKYDKKITLSLSDEHYERFDEYVKANYTDMSKQLRKWIDQFCSSIRISEK